MEREFKKWMDFFGKPYTPFELIRGDFLSEEYAEMLKRGTYAAFMFIAHIFTTLLCILLKIITSKLKIVLFTYKLLSTVSK